MNTLDQLKQMTVVVADTGDIQAMKAYSPQDATTNPSLLLASAQLPEYRHLIDETIRDVDLDLANPQSDLAPLLEALAVRFGMEILNIIPGRVSVEVDAGLSFDVNATVETAQRLIQAFETKGISRDRILIKIASTWEGIKAAEILEKQDIHCNLTLLFSLPQAIAAAEANVTLISPFVGRILDWHLAKTGKTQIPAEEDPGVLSVRTIYHYYKRFGYQTEIMGASFRNMEEIIQLAGCDLLTISPNLLEDLSKDTHHLERILSPEMAQEMDIKRLALDENAFRWAMNEDAMATEKLAEGIRRFRSDLDKLEDFLRQEKA
ncbi:MAG: transaldolase [Candidatus Marinimicrobia bacterium]|nr:transaldolase [Candidatus Neomarinimicrobiota bacterium]MCF7851144.1 transaldolase [Candidatus Neomarinimicrobiota bacterium]MCF7904061.1 transaldolase [Candidatus Neomarinimicrobiota bacterium]